MNKKVTNETSIAKQVRDTLLRRPFLVNAISQGVVNYSALARVLQKEIEGSIAAIKAAIIREKENIANEREFREKRVLSLLKESKINLQDKIAVVISEHSQEIPSIASSEITTHHIYVVDQTKVDLESIKNAIIDKNLVALILTSPEEIETIPGVIAFISQLLASHNINIKEFISCYTDTIIVLKPENALKAFALLQKYI